MEAPKCGGCAVPTSFRRLRRVEVRQRHDYPVRLVSDGRPICVTCAGHALADLKHFETAVVTVPTAPCPNDVELADWISENGETDPAFVSACEEHMQDMIADGELRVETTSVPYGSMMVTLPDVDMPEKVLLATAYQWFEDGKVDWSPEVGPVLQDGSQHVWLVTTSDDERE